MKFSIITPNYNGFDLMSHYFNSLENQTYKDFEIIIVDDCSTDGSYEKLKQYASNAIINIKILQSEINLGPGNARNVGLKEAQGEWVTFIDNDDWVDITLFEQITKVINENEVNCVVIDYNLTNGERNSVSKSMYYGGYGIMPLHDSLINVRNHTHCKFYKRSCCIDNNVFFPANIRRHEDIAFVFRAVAACKSVFYYNKPLYYYYQRPQSLSNNKKMDEKVLLTAFGVLENKMRNIYPEEIAEKSVTDLLYGGVLVMCKAGKSRRYINEYLDKYEKKYPNWRESNIINHVGRSKKLYLKFISNRNIYMLRVLTFAHSLLIKRGAL